MISEKERIKIQTSETFLLSSLLALSGGFQDAYTYNVRDKVFSNAQTGNVVLMSQHLMQGEWQRALHYLFPVLAFALGVLVAEQIGHKYKGAKRIHWRQIILFCEIVFLLVVGFLPAYFEPLANAMVSFVCAMQVQTFHKVRGHAYASTMCIGNMRSGTEALCAYFRTRDKEILQKSLTYFGVIFVFGIGAGLGSLMSGLLGTKAIWCCCVSLLVSFVMMFVPEKNG